jgi:hypothetical protein
MANPKYAYWEARQRGEDPQAVNEQPECGFYRVRRVKGGPFVPLAIFPSSGEIIGFIGAHSIGEEIEADKLGRMWPWACKNDISEAVYRDVAENGKDWPDVDATVSAAQREAIGGNNPPDEAALLAEQIANARAGIADYATITDDDHNARAQTLRARLQELSRNADTLRKGLKKPHQDLADAVDEKWMPLVKSSKADADKIKAAMEAFATAKIRKRETEQAAIDAEQAKFSDNLQTLGVRVPAFAPPPPLPTQVKGAIGKAAHIGERLEIKSVDDIDLLFAHFKLEPDVRQCLVKLAKIAVDAGQTVPGITVEKVGKVR